MDQATQLYIARAAVGLGVLLLVWLCSIQLREIENESDGELPQNVTQLRSRHVIPVIGLAATGISLAAFGMALFPN